MAYFTSPTAHTPEYHWRGRTFPRPTEQLNLPYSSVGADQSRSNRAATSLPNQRPRRFLIHIAKAHSYINLAGVLGERDLKKKETGNSLLIFGNELDPSRGICYRAVFIYSRASENPTAFL